jgi:serine protease Do
MFFAPKSLAPLFLVAFTLAIGGCQLRTGDAPEPAPAEKPKKADSPAPDTQDTASPQKASSPDPIALPGAHLAQIPGVAEQAVKSVVNIASEKRVKMPERQRRMPFFNDPFFRQFFGDPGRGQPPRERLERGLGSGVIVSSDGIVLTNNHVINAADSLKVALSDGREFDAEVVGTDPKSDLGVIRIKESPTDLVPIPLGDSGKLRLGEMVLAVGNPFGVGQTVTMGIVSAKGRADVGIVDYEDFIQTDAAINPGNSGGALVNMKGELVGINTAILSKSGGYQGIGFAIPSNMARAIKDNLLEHGRVIRGWLGVAIQDLDKKLATAMELEIEKGVLISHVGEESPAEKAGLQRGDVILKLDGEMVESTSKLRNRIAAKGAGKKVALHFLREGKEEQLDVTLGELPDERSRIPTPSGNKAAPGEVAGMEVQPVSPELAETFKLDSRLRGGLVVVNVEGGAAVKAGLRPGDVILEAGRREVRTTQELGALWKQSRGSLLLRVLRGSSAFYVVLEE